MDEEKLIDLAVDAGEIMLKSGGEIHRVEDTMTRIMSTAGSDSEPEAVVFPTGIFASMNGKKGKLTKVKRLEQGNTDLTRLDRVNTLSRKFVSGEFTLGEAMQDMERIKKIPSVTNFMFVLGICMTCLFFTLMFEGNSKDGFTSMLTGIVLGITMLFLSTKNISYFISRFLCGAVLTIVTLIFYTYNICSEYDKVIIGCLMPLVPGVTITTALRDVLNGDFISGVSRVAEATLVAVAAAGGVGIILKLWAGM